MRRLIGEDIDIRWHPGRKLSPVKIDPSQLEQILANLCFNARDAISGVGEIIVETKMVAFDDEGRKDHADNMRGNFVMLSVSDDGCGIETQALDNIFEPFFTTKGVSQGTGLGLATVDGIVKQNNGVIHVHSAPDRGTTFTIYLPQHVGAIEEFPLEEITATPPGEDEMVLLVEDEPAIRELCQFIQKPFSIKDMAVKIREALRGP